MSDTPLTSAPVAYRAVFEFSPSGIVVTDARGRVQRINLRGKRMLGDLVREGLRCCDLFDCRRPGTPLASHCITALTLSQQGPMPEIRTDLPDENGSVWVTGASFGGVEPMVVLQMRPGVAGDRRRRTEPHWMGDTQLRVFTLGRTRVESAEAGLPEEWLSHGPGRVLKYLVTHRGRVVSADELMEAFWPEAGPRAATSVRQAVHTLRSRLQPERPKGDPPAFVVGRSGGYELERATVWVDADDLESYTREGLRSRDPQTAEAALLRAVGLYRGDFLAEEPYAEWALAERDRLRDVVCRALRALSTIRCEAGDLDAASEHLNRLSEIEPFDMDAHRELLTLLVRRGRRAEAARRHEGIRRRYRRTFGDDPPFDLASLAAR